MAATISVAPTGNQDIDGVLWSSRWSDLNLTYSFPTRASYYGEDYRFGEPQDNFAALSEDQRDAARQVFAMIAAVTNLTFTEVTETSTTHATLRLASSDAPSTGWSYLPEPADEGGDTWFGRSNGLFDDPVLGSYAYFGFIHEILHSVGLKHGHETEVFGAMTSAHDSMEFSATTYRSYVDAGVEYVENEPWGYAQSLMMYDIAALQYLYGADFTSNAGNTVYRWSPTTGQEFINGIGQETPGENRIFMTVWDGGGNDTYDFSKYVTNLKVDLRPGEWSRLSTGQIAQLGEGHDARGNIANALTYRGDPRSLIENAYGGVGNDVITGNAAANSLKGGNGADLLYGREGNDMLWGGAGKDIFFFNTKPSSSSNRDQLVDFSVADDTIHLENAVFTNLGSAGKLSAAAFWKGAKAHDSTDRIVYDAAQGGLYYDADGTGKASSVQFAQVSKELMMTSADFAIV
ncbi:M10 family metallopeptidase [Microvirga vignae]|uniref:M10 family metallopeptidase n=1 Tax=Microvirga vignae TaxID=1225564 RepID=UPI00069B3EE2|nr:M10 family metallopeptidase [Microvirga vignae]